VLVTVICALVQPSGAAGAVVLAADVVGAGAVSEAETDVAAIVVSPALLAPMLPVA
jgi:hypothetical protein